MDERSKGKGDFFFFQNLHPHYSRKRSDWRKESAEIGTDDACVNGSQFAGRIRECYDIGKEHAHRDIVHEIGA